MQQKQGHDPAELESERLTPEAKRALWRFLYKARFAHFFTLCGVALGFFVLVVGSLALLGCYAESLPNVLWCVAFLGVHGFLAGLACVRWWRFARRTLLRDPITIPLPCPLCHAENSLQLHRSTRDVGSFWWGYCTRCTERIVCESCGEALIESSYDSSPTA